MPAKVAVIGAGGMGSWFARFFKSKRYLVTITDRDTSRARVLASRLRVRHVASNVEAVRGSRIVVLATPTNATARVIKEILPVLDRNALVCEISATKSTVMPALRSAQRRGATVASIHPMFGPLASGVRGRTIIAVKTGKSKRTEEIVKQLFKGARIISVDARTHDEQMTLTLGLPHLLNMAFAMTLLRKGDLAKIRRYAGRTFNLQMLLAAAIANEPETIAEIQTLNSKFPAVLRQLQREIHSLEKIVNKRDTARLTAQYMRVKRALYADLEFKGARQMFERVAEAYSAAASRGQH